MDSLELADGEILLDSLALGDTDLDSEVEGLMDSELLALGEILLDLDEEGEIDSLEDADGEREGEDE
jgi:hypothetical protein